MSPGVAMRNGVCRTPSLLSIPAMASPESRYDPIADWYAEFTRDWGTEPVALLPAEVTGQRILDQGCGQGGACRHLAERGARMVGIDLSSEMLAHARRLEAGQRLGIEYLWGDAASTEWWDGASFDGVLSNMALMDIDDLNGALGVAARVLRTGGWLSLSLFHPCYPGGPEGSASGLPSWPPDRGYDHEGWWTTNGEGVRGHVGANHRMVSTYLNAVVRAGFAIEGVGERAKNVLVYLMVRASKI